MYLNFEGRVEPAMILFVYEKQILLEHLLIAWIYMVVFVGCKVAPVSMLYEKNAIGANSIDRFQII